MAGMLQSLLAVGVLLHLAGITSALKGPKELDAFLGRPLSLVCGYEEGFKAYKKYWCKGSNWDSCIIVVYTDGTNEVTAGRTSIQDNQARLEFTVRLEKFSQEDAGIYWCGIERTGADISFRIQITARPEPTTTTAATTTTVPAAAASPTTPPSPDVLYVILLPTVFLVLVVILIGATLLMCRLKKQKAAKASKDVPIPLAPRVPVKQNDGYRPEAAPPSSNQGPDSARELEYASVKTTPASAASLPQVPTNTEDVSYASLKFSTLEEEPTYANV